MLRTKKELAAARRALEAGDAAHAARHAADALALSPGDAEVLELIDQLVKLPAPGLGGSVSRLLGTGPLAPLFPQDGFAGNLAARARAHWLRGELQAALDLSLTLGSQVPFRPFVDWALRIADDARARKEPLQPSAFLRAYGRLGQSTMGLLHLRPMERRFFTPWAELGRRLLGLAPAGTDATPLKVATSALLRRTGAYEEAIAVLGPLEAGTHATALVLRGLALRAQGKWDAAVESFEQAMRAPGGDPSYILEIGRVYWDAGRWKEAYACLNQSDGQGFEEGAALNVLAEHLDASLPRFWTQLLGESAPYDALRRVALGLDLPPLMGDASTNTLEQLEAEPPNPVVMHTTCLESPSVLMTLALRTLGRPQPDTLQYTASAEPTPHPFEPLDRTLGFRLWERSGTLVSQALPPPPETVTARVDALTRSLQARQVPEQQSSISLTRAWELACAEPGLDSLEPTHLLAAMLHPSRPDAWKDTVTWVFERQVVAAMLLAAQDRGRPWLSSRGRRSLQGLVLGHPDWTLAAGLLALRERLLDTPEALEDARDWCERLLQSQPDQGHVAWASALRSMLLVPGMDAHAVSRITVLAHEGQG